MRNTGKIFAIVKKTGWAMVGAAAALALKAQYSLARAEDLTWILSPMAWLVQILTGQNFYFDPTEGYVSHALGVVIAPACAGVNFMIAVFCMSYFSGIFKQTGTKAASRWLTGCAITSYFSTIIANSIRIHLSIVLITHDIHMGWLTPMRVHRISGIMIYFFFLNLVYHIIRKNFFSSLFCADDNAPARNTTGRYFANYSGGARQSQWFWPLFWYWGISLAVPFLNGARAANPAGFAEHSLTVGLVSLSLCTGYIFSNRFCHNKRILVYEPRDTDH